MPAVSKKQRRAMWAAAMGKSAIGIPQEVGKEFVHADSAPTCAGVLYSTPDGEHLLGRRADGRDHGGEWAMFGGHLEDGETPAQAAAREFQEETGIALNPESLVHLGDSNGFSNFHYVGPKQDVQIDGEHSEAGWFKSDSLPGPLHPGMEPVFYLSDVVGLGADEGLIAQLIGEGKLPSPQLAGNSVLFAMRITGTGAAYRVNGDQFAWRDPEQYLTDAFLRRCQGLPVIWEHAPGGELDTSAFENQVIGAVMIPYVRDSEVWGVVRVSHLAAAEAIMDGQYSTSPSVVTDGDKLLTLPDGMDILIEGKPGIVDHLAICPVGVWDKGREPSGIQIDNVEVPEMAEETPEVQTQENAALAKILSALESLDARIGAIEGKKPDASPMEGVMPKVDAACAKADEAHAKLADLEARIPQALSDAEIDEVSQAQAKADSVFVALGEATPRPLAGERPLAYRVRIANKLKGHSETWKDVDLAKADSAVLAIAEPAIYADAKKSADKNVAASEGKLVARENVTGAGHRIREYAGDNRAYLNVVRMEPARLVGLRKQGG